MALGRCTAKPWDGHEGQWPYRKHPCASFAGPDSRPSEKKECCSGTTGDGQRRGSGFYVEALKREACVCGRQKRSGLVFCNRCFNGLPRDLRKRLWQRLGEGFEDAYEEALAMVEKGRCRG
jgi:hypothetical protein